MEVADQTMLWSDRFDGVIEDPFSLQDQVAAAVVGVLRGTFHTSRGARTVDVEANDVAMRVRDLLNTPTFLRDHGGRELVARLEASLTPQSAEAWALIATAQAASRWTADEEDEVRLRQQAQASIDRALAADPLCGEAHKARYLLAPPAGHFAGTAASLEDVSRVIPRNGEVRWALFQLGLALGRVREAAAHAEAAYRVDPLRPPNVTAYGVALHALGETRLLLHLRPGRYSAAARASTDRVLFMVQAYRHPRREALERTIQRVQRDVVEGRPRFSLVALWANLGGDLDAIYDTLTATAVAPLCAPAARLGLLDGLAHLFLPVNARLRQTPRFLDLCRSLGLVEYWTTTGRWPDCVTAAGLPYEFVQTARDPGLSVRS